MRLREATKTDHAASGSVLPRSTISMAVAAVLGLAATAVPHDARAQQRVVLEEILVTAQKREEDLQDVPISISALEGKDLELKGAAGFRDWSEYVPGVILYQGTGANRRAGPTAVIRGVSQTGGGQLNEMSSMATTSYMFGQVPVFSSDPGVFDLNRIEVLRGPQGTLFGIASMGGTIRFMPNRAETGGFSAEVGADFGMMHEGGDTVNLDAMINIPIIEDKLAVRIAAVSRESDGYIDVFRIPLTETDPAQIFVNGQQFDPRLRDGENVWRDANSTSTTGARLSAKFTPNDRFSVDAFAQWQTNDQRHKQIIDYNDQSKDWVASRFTLEPQRDEFVVGSLEASYDLGPAQIDYVFGYFDSTLSETLDVTPLVTAFLNGTGANSAILALDADGPGGLPPDASWPSATQFPFGDTRQEIVSNELRLQGTDLPLFGSDIRLDYVVGLFHMSEDRSGEWRVANPTWNANRGPNTVPILTDGGLMTGAAGGGTYESQAVFADLALHLTPKWSFGAGVRYSENERESAQQGWGDVTSGRAANGATVGDDLTAPGTPSAVGEISQDDVTPRFTIQYHQDDDKLWFATAAQGVRMPSSFANPNFWSNPGAPSNPVCQSLAQTLGVYDDAVNGTTTDSVWSYDLGLKSTWLDRRLQVNASVYYLDWQDLQRNVQMSQFEPSCNILIPANVGAVEVTGFELEIIYIPTDSVTMNATVGYVDAQVAETVPGVNDSLGQQLEKGDDIENVAPLTGSFGLEYRFGLGALDSLLGDNFGGFARIDWRYTDERLGTNIGDAASIKADPIRSQFVADPYSLTDVRIGMNNNDWTASLYVSNLFNERAMFESFRQSFFPNQRMVSVSRPRTIGVAIKRRF